jgi:hypothetical protein
MQKKEKIPHKGSLALCRLGSLGLITKSVPQMVEYGDGNKGVAYVGIHLTDKISEIGKPWSSRHPKVITHIDNVVEFISMYHMLSTYMSREEELEALRIKGRISKQTDLTEGPIKKGGVNQPPTSPRPETKLEPQWPQFEQNLEEQTLEEVTEQDMEKVREQIQQVANDPNLVIGR